MGDMFFCCFFRFKTLRRVYKINKFRGIPGYKKTQVLNHPVAYGSTMGQLPQEANLGRAVPPKKIKDPKNL